MNIIKVKLIGSDGAVKGRAYTYKSAIPVSVGDRVVADMAGTKKVLEVVETGIPQEEIENLPYEIKFIDGLAEDGAIQEEPLDIKIMKEVPPVLKINFEEVKSGLSAMLETYQGIVVTEQTLQGCKATQKELASVRTKLDKYRKEKKKALSKPITDFENQCKELIAMVESVEKPIKEGIALFDNERRQAKRREAEAIRESLLKDSGLNETYAALLQIKDVHCNLSATKAMVTSDMKAEIEILTEKQRAEEMKEEAILAAIEAQNGRLNKKLSIKDFQYMLSAELPTILREIQLKADIIFEAEHPKEEPPAPEPEPIESESEPAPEVAKPQAVYSVRLQGELSAIKAILGLAQAKGLEVEVTGEMNL